MVRVTLPAFMVAGGLFDPVLEDDLLVGNGKFHSSFTC
jgi:hypothetical protein